MKGWDIELAAHVYDIEPANLSRNIKKVEHLHRQIHDFNIIEDISMTLIDLSDLTKVREYVQYLLETSDDAFREKLLGVLDEHVALREQLDEAKYLLKDSGQLSEALGVVAPSRS